MHKFKIKVGNNRVFILVKTALYAANYQRKRVA